MYTEDYLEAKQETAVSDSFYRSARRAEKRWELEYGQRTVADVLGSGSEGFDDLGEFLGNRKAESVEYSVDSISGNSEVEKILGTTTSEDLNFVNAQVNNLSMMNVYDTFLGIYMSPNGAFADINYRLGKVAKTLLKNTESSQVNSDGSMYTRSNFFKKFNYQVTQSYGSYGGYAAMAPYYTQLYYANLFFPPYASASDPSKSFLSTYVPATNRSTRNGHAPSSWATYYSYLQNSSKWASNETLHFDESNFSLKRDGEFTYRHIGFKSINDNITFLQWIFENTTGVVSTYLTEWDMSVYFQEGFIPNKDNQRLSLLYRIDSDNPMKDHPTYNQYATDGDNLNYLTFGVVNAATSLSTNGLKWNVNKFPLSKYWTQYPNIYVQNVEHGDDYDEQCLLLNSPILSAADQQALSVQIAAETSITYSPDFLEPASLNPAMLYSGSPFMKKIEYCDRRGAAISGWWSWDLQYYKALYTVPGNELSNLDANNMIEDSSNLYGIAAANKDEGSTDNDGDDGSGTGAGSSGYGSSKGGRKWFLKKRPKSGKKGAAKARAKGNAFVASAVYMGETETVLANSATGGNGSGSGSPSATGAGAAATGGDMVFDESKSLQYSDSTGLPDYNPVYYGGPHGAGRSPKNPKSFFEVDNPLMRNVPRIDPPESFDSKDLRSYLNGLNQFYSYRTRTGSTDWANAERVKGISENSFVGGLNLMKNGVQEKRWMLSMSYGKRYVNVKPDWWWWGWWWWGRYNRYQDYYPTHTYTYNGSFWGWHRLYYDSWNTFHTHGFWGNNISGYSYYNNDYVNTGSWFWWWHCQWRTRRAYYYTYEYRWSERYMLHGDPYAQWKMEELSYNNYVINTPYSVLSYWFSVFRRYRNQAISYVRAIGSSRQRLELTGTGYCAVEKNFGNWPAQSIRWTSGTMSIMDYFVKNSREFGTKNYLIFMAGLGLYYSGGWGVPEAIFRAPVSMREYSFSYYYDARDRRRRRRKCRRRSCKHMSVGWHQYIDVGLFDDDEYVPFSLMSTHQPGWSNIGARDIFEEMTPPSGYQRQYDDISQLFSGGALYGCGIYSSLQGFEPMLDDLEGTDYRALLDIGRLSNTRFCDIRFNYFQVNNYAIAPRNTVGGYTYYPIGGFETYSAGWMPAGQSWGLLNGMLSGSLYMAGRMSSRVCYGDSAFRLLYAQISNQIQFYKMAKDVVLSDTVLPPANIREMLLRCVDPKVIKVSYRNLSTYDNEDTHYNYWIERAFAYFDGPPSQVKAYMDGIRAELNLAISSYESFLAYLYPLVTKHVFNWTYAEYKTAILDYLPMIKQSVQGDLMFDEFFYCYLNILYEYRKYFINKRFNKVDGSYYQLRHLEGLLSYMKGKTSTGDIPTMDYSGESQAEIVPVSFYTVNHTVEEKTAAVTSGVALPADEILKLYIPVTYSTEAKFLRELTKKKSDPEYKMRVVKTAREDSEKRYAEVPVDYTYKFLSDQYTKNENNKKVNKILTEKYLKQSLSASHVSLLTVADPDYSTLIKYVAWGDEVSKTPIEENIAVNIDAMALVDALQVTTDLHEAVCAAKQLQDYWTVNVSANNCQSRGYKTGLKLVPYAPADGSSVAPITVEESAMGVNANQLWPISEEQAQITTTMSISESQKLKIMADTGLSTGDEFIS